MEQYGEAAVTTEQSLFELQVDHEVSSHLTQTAKWTKFLSIVGFIGMGLLVLVVVLMGTLFSALSPLAASGIPASGGFLQVVILLAMVALYFFPCLFLFNFSNKMLRAIRDNDQYSLVASFRQLKLCFKFMGILTIVMLSLYALALLFAMIFAATR